MMKKWPIFCNIWNFKANLGKTSPSKYVEVIHWFYIFEKPLKEPIPTTTFREKNINKTPQNDKNYQISIRISIKAYFGKTFSWKFLKAYNLLLLLLSPEKKLNLILGMASLLTDVSSSLEMAGFALAEMSWKIENHNSVKTYILIK